MINQQPQNFPEPSAQDPGTSFTVTPRLINFLRVLKGAKVSTTQAEQIYKGILDLLIGFVASQNYQQGSGGPEQVTILTEAGEYFTLTNNPDVRLNPEIFNFFGNADLINRPRVIWISNLSAFREQFQEAAKFGQRVACIYNRINGEIDVIGVDGGMQSPMSNDSRTTPAFLNQTQWPHRG